MRRNLITCLVLSCLLVPFEYAFADEVPPRPGLTGEADTTVAAFDLSWWSVDAGGGPAEGGGFSLMAAIGQHDAGTASGSTFDFAGGLWSEGGTAPSPDIFSDDFESSNASAWTSAVGLIP